MQGETVSSILCTSSIDRISKDSPVDDFKYRDKVNVPKQSFVDDMMDVQNCSENTRKMNIYTLYKWRNFKKKTNTKWR